MRFSLVVPFVLALGMGSLVACSSKTVAEGTPATTPDAGSASGGEEDAAAATPAGPMTLTSTEFEEGGQYPAKYTCNGDDTKSPPLAWTPGPEGTKSYAIIFTDKTNSLVHSAIYDIPADVMSLPENVEGAYEPKTPAGAKQSLNYKSEPGYAGPCPPTGEHTYELALYALDVEALPDLTKDSTGSVVRTAVLKHDLTSSKLTAKYTKTK